MTKLIISVTEMISFKNKKVLITGASSGIGRAIAIRFADAGANLMLLDMDSEGLVDTINLCMKNNGQNHQSTVIDLSNKSTIDEYWKSLSKDDIPDVLINNAGIYPMMNFLKIEEDFLKKVFDVNLNSIFWMCQNYIKKRRKNGIIVSLSSIEAILPFKKDMTHYSAAKAGVIAFARSIARDYGRLGFRSNVVMPGAILTSGTQTLMKNAILGFKMELLKTGYDFQQRLANNKWGQPDDVAKVVLFLSSDLASYVQGAIVPVDGGFLSS